VIECNVANPAYFAMPTAEELQLRSDRKRATLAKRQSPVPSPGGVAPCSGELNEPEESFEDDDDDLDADDGSYKVYLPTPEQIKEECRLIRLEWSEESFVTRREGIIPEELASAEELRQRRNWRT